MKKLSVIMGLMILFSMNASLFADTNADELWTRAIQANAEFKQADDEMGRIFKQVKEEYQEDKVFIKKLVAAQVAWIKYRDAQLEAVFPEENQDEAYGSSFIMCYGAIARDLTIERTKALMVWLNGIPRGDPCAGSRRIAPSK